MADLVVCGVKTLEPSEGPRLTLQQLQDIQKGAPSGVVPLMAVEQTGDSLFARFCRGLRRIAHVGNLFADRGVK